MENNYDTRDRIILAALDLFMKQGIKKTSLEEIAQQAGVTRITVYRYFEDKKDLVQAAFVWSETPFQQALHDLEQNPNRAPKEILGQIGRDLSRLPAGNPVARLDELKHLYPDIYAEFQKMRLETLEGIFDHLFSTAERTGALRPGITRQIAQAVFWPLVINAFDNPWIRDLGLSDTEMFSVLSDVLLYGILKDRREE